MYAWYVTIGVTENGSHVAFTEKLFNSLTAPTDDDREEIKVITARASVELQRVLERRKAAGHTSS